MSVWGVRPAIHPTASGVNESQHTVRLVAPDPTVTVTVTARGTPVANHLAEPGILILSHRPGGRLLVSWRHNPDTASVFMGPKQVPPISVLEAKVDGGQEGLAMFHFSAWVLLGLGESVQLSA